MTTLLFKDIVIFGLGCAITAFITSKFVTRYVNAQWEEIFEGKLDEYFADNFSKDSEK